MRSPKSKFGFKKVEGLEERLFIILDKVSALSLKHKPKLKTYCMIKRLVLFSIKPPSNKWPWMPSKKPPQNNLGGFTF